MADFSRQRIINLNTARLADVDSTLAVKCLKIIELAQEAGFDLLVTQGYRSIQEQNRLFAQGRTRPGKIVTNARGGQSNHNFRKAVDFAFIVDGEVSWDVKFYKRLGAWCEQVGLKWGGNWKRFKDYPHVEL